MSQQSKNTETAKQAPVEATGATDAVTEDAPAVKEPKAVVKPEPVAAPAPVATAVVPGAVIAQMLEQYASIMSTRFHSEESLASGYNTMKHIVRVAIGKLGPQSETVPSMRALLKWLGDNANGLASETNLFRGFETQSDHQLYLLLLTYLKLAAVSRKAKPENYSPKPLQQLLGENDSRVLTGIVADAIKG